MWSPLLSPLLNQSFWEMKKHKNPLSKSQAALTSTLDFCTSPCGSAHTHSCTPTHPHTLTCSHETHTHSHTVTEQEQQLRVEVGWQGEGQGFTALTKIKHEDFVVHGAVGKTNIIFFTSERSPGTGCIKCLNDWMAEVLKLVTLAEGSWSGWVGGG